VGLPAISGYGDSETAQSGTGRGLLGHALARTGALAGHLVAIARLRLVDPNTSPVERDRIRRFVADPW